MKQVTVTKKEQHANTRLRISYPFFQGLFLGTWTKLCLG